MLAQLTDLHLLNPAHRSDKGFLRRRLLSYARPLDAADRYARVKRALAAARHAGHMVLTGDLTEDGSLVQFEVLAELLEGIPPETVTLIPGNHDRYVDGFYAALDGPLKKYKATSQPGVPIDLGEISVIPVDTTIRQHYMFSRGRLHADHWRDVLAATQARIRAGKTVVLAQHHPVRAHAFLPMHFFDGNWDHALQVALLEASEKVFVIHGHTHQRRDSGRVFAASAVVDSDNPVRFYGLSEEKLVSLHQPGDASVVVHHDAAS